PDQSVSVGDTGNSVFMNLAAGNGTFTTSAAAANGGSGSIDPRRITRTAAWGPHTYTIAFTSATQYPGTNAARPVPTSGNYVSSDAITSNGAQVTISAPPASGDQFTVAPAGTASVFSTINGLINTLNSPTLSSAQAATQIGGALQQIDTALNNMANVQA